jgi:single-strand DNA-binding protein
MTELAEFTIANNRGFGESKRVNFIDVKLLSKSAPKLMKYLVKGKQIAVTGELRTERWNDSETGQPKQRLLIVSYNIDLMANPEWENEVSEEVVY